MEVEECENTSVYYTEHKLKNETGEAWERGYHKGSSMYRPLRIRFLPEHEEENNTQNKWCMVLRPTKLLDV